jgi:uncharacterized protein
MNSSAEQHPSLLPHLRRRLTLETQAIYRLADALFAPFSCPGSSECCQLQKTQRPPWLLPSEWLVIEDSVKSAQRAIPSPRVDGACPFLDEAGKRCTIYADRPLGCRTYFCDRIRGPKSQPTVALNALMQRLVNVNESCLDDVNAKPLWDWF